MVYVIFFDVHWSDGFGNGRSTGATFVQTSRTPLQQAVVQKTVPAVSGSDDIYYNPVYNPIISPSTSLTTWVTDPVVKNAVQKSVQDLVDSQVRKTNTTDTQLIQNTWSTRTNSSTNLPEASVPVKLPEVIEDLQWRKFFSTDYLFGRESSSTITPSTVSVSWWIKESPTIVVQNENDSTVVSAPTQGTTVVDPAATQDQPPVDTASKESVWWEIALVNTWKRDWTLDIIDKLNLEDDVSYILKDIHNTHFIYLWKFNEPMIDIVAFLGWTSVDIVDQIAIQNSQLLGKKVTKMVVPSYKRNLKELMIITFENGDSWFLQIDKDYYSVLENKIYVKSLFEQFY